MTVRHQYDRELGKITAEDREYAADLIEDIAELTPHPLAGTNEQVSLIAQWFRKVRYEAVIADRKVRGNAYGETQAGEKNASAE